MPAWDLAHERRERGWPSNGGESTGGETPMSDPFGEWVGGGKPQGNRSRGTLAGVIGRGARGPRPTRRLPLPMAPGTRRTIADARMASSAVGGRLGDAETSDRDGAGMVPPPAPDGRPAWPGRRRSRRFPRLRAVRRPRIGRLTARIGGTICFGGQTQDFTSERNLRDGAAPRKPAPSGARRGGEPRSPRGYGPLLRGVGRLAGRAAPTAS
jgi:hypothetical protein